MDTLENMLSENVWLHATVVMSMLLLAAWVANYITKHIVLRLLRRIVGRLQGIRNQDAIDLPISARIANLIPILIVSVGVRVVGDLPQELVEVVGNVCAALSILTVVIALAHVLDYINLVYMRAPDAHHRPIKGYIQVGKLLIYLIGIILIVASLIDRSPLILLSGLGAMAAVLMLIFQDTILSLVASVQISSSGVVRVGDWIEMPQMQADGDVVDIALHTVTVRNWDKTLTVFPTKKLVTEPFKNWRGMSESGGRRIKRALYLDQSSVRFLDEAAVRELNRFAVLDDYLARKRGELADWNQRLVEQGRDPVNARRVTNLGTFRAYVEHYLKHHPQVHQGMTLLVRQLQPGATGMPLEIYCFTSTTAWVAYESIQADIFDHLLAILPQFGLRVFQQPAGADLARLGEALAPALRSGSGPG